MGSSTLPLLLSVCGFLGLWILKAFLFEGFGVWTPVFEDVCVVQNSGCKICVRKKQQTTGGGVCSETQKTQCLKLGFY